MLSVIAAAAGLAASALVFGRKPEEEASERVTLPKSPWSTLDRKPAPRPQPSLPAPRPQPSRPTGALYVPDDSAPYGPYHIRRRPRGLPTVVAEANGPAGRVRVDGIDPAAARRLAINTYTKRHGARPARILTFPVRAASARGAAVRVVADVAGRAGLGEDFVKTMTHLARTEGEGGTFAVPARNFRAACLTRDLDPRRLCTPVDAPRPAKQGLITAWGVFQWNRDAGRELRALDDLGLDAPHIPSDWMPWDWTAAEEIELPVDYYAQLWRLVQQHGGTPRDAARGARLWHTGPSRFRTWLARGADARAWAAMPATVTKKIDNHLAHAGVA